MTSYNKDEKLCFKRTAFCEAPTHSTVSVIYREMLSY